jgi:hypothetical protein
MCEAAQSNATTLHTPFNSQEHWFPLFYNAPESRKAGQPLAGNGSYCQRADVSLQFFIDILTTHFVQVQAQAQAQGSDHITRVANSTG